MQNEIRYFSMFSGVGGFELGLSRSSGTVKSDGEETNLRNTNRNKPIFERQEDNDNTRDNRDITDTENTDRTLFQNRQEQSNPKSRDMEEVKEDIKTGRSVRSGSDGILREGNGIRDDKEDLQFGENKSNSVQFKCVGLSEIDKYASELLKQKFPSVKNWGDCKTINPNELPDFDMLCGGFPCQAFSIAGKRRGFEDTRGTLFFEIARILKIKRPKIVLLENVKGLLNHEKGKTFSTIIQTLAELGYRTQWMVLNSKFFGVPQNRERVFIIGSLRGECRSEILPFGENVRESFEESSEICQCHSARYYKGGNGTHIQVKGYLNENGWEKRNESIRRIYGEDGFGPCLPTGQGGGVIPKIMAVLTPDRPEKRQNGRRMKEPGEPSFTLTGQDVHGVIQINPSLESGGKQPYQQNRIYKKEGISPALPSELGGDRSHLINTIKIRRLTPTECERLQGFPDGWTKEFSDTQRYKMMGNAVTVNVIEAIGRRILNE